MCVLSRTKWCEDSSTLMMHPFLSLKDSLDSLDSLEVVGDVKHVNSAPTLL